MNAQVSILRWFGVLAIAWISACGGGGGGDGDISGPPGTLQLLETSLDASEGTVVNILVARNGGNSGVVSVDYAVEDGTAIAGADYPVTNGTLTYANGVSGNQTISIAITDDNVVERSETFTVTLSNVSGATLGANSSATVNIIDNDTAVLPITADNARAITSNILEAITSTIDLLDVLDFIGVPAVGNASASRAVVLPKIIVTDIVPCDSGETTVTWNDVDNNVTLSTGDTFDIVFNMCFLADTGTTLSGATSLTSLIVSGDPVTQIAPWRLATTLGFDNLSAADGAGTTTLVGSLNLDLSSADNVVINLSMGTASIAAQQSNITETLTDYVLTETFDLNTLTQVASSSGSLSSTSLAGTISFLTLQEFIIVADDNPSTGQLLISDSVSSVLVTVLDNINVQLEIDLDLDGTVDETIVLPWSEFDID